MKIYNAPFYTESALEELTEEQVHFPFSDKDATYDGLFHQYQLTERYFEERGVSLHEKIEGSDPEKVKHFLKELCKLDMDIEFVGNDTKLYSDFTYVITGEYDNFGGKFDIDKLDYLNRINVKVYDGDEQGELLFDGNGLEYLGWKNWE